MKEGSPFSEDFIKESIKLLVLLSINLYLNKEVFTQNDIKGQGITLIVSLGGFLVYFIIITILKAIKKPVLIEVDLKNKVTQKNKTEFIHFITGREDSRTVILSICVTKTNSIWYKPALWFLENRSIKFKVSIQPPDDWFICKPSIISSHIELVENLFEIDVKELIRSSLSGDLVTFNRSYNLILTENDLNPPEDNCNFIIKPNILLNDKSLNIFTKLIIDMRTSNNCHEVNFYK